MTTNNRSVRHHAFEKVHRESDEEENEEDSVDPSDIGTVSLTEIRRRLTN